MAEQLYKDIEIDGESYRIKKFSAVTGMQIARLILSKMTPLIPMLSSLSNDPDALMKNVGVLSQCLDGISDEEIDSLIRKCLKVCQQKKAMGYARCMEDSGAYGVEGLKYNLSLTLKLCWEAISWGAADFFAASGLGSILKQARTSTPSNS